MMKHDIKCVRVIQVNQSLHGCIVEYTGRTVFYRNRIPETIKAFMKTIGWSRSYNKELGDDFIDYDVYE